MYLLIVCIWTLSVRECCTAVGSCSSELPLRVADNKGQKLKPPANKLKVGILSPQTAVPSKIYKISKTTRMPLKFDSCFFQCRLSGLFSSETGYWPTLEFLSLSPRVQDFRVGLPRLASMASYDSMIVRLPLLLEPLLFQKQTDRDKTFPTPETLLSP